MAKVQTTKVKLTNYTGGQGNFWIAHHANSNLGLKMLPPPAAAHAVFPQSMAYCFSVAPSQTVEFAVESEVGHDAVMDYWYVGFTGVWSGPNLCVLDRSTILLPQWALKIGDNTGFGVREGTAPGTYEISMYTNYGGGQQSGVSIVKPISRRGIEPWPTIRQNAATFTDGFRQGYVEAMKKLKQSPSQLQPPTNSRYDDYVLVHMLAMNIVSFKTPAKPPIIDNSTINVGAQRDPMWAHERPLFIP